MTENQRIALALGCTLLWLLWVAYLYLRHRRAIPRAHRQQDPVEGHVLIAYASQSGTAATLARQSADHLGASRAVTLLPLSQVSSETLRVARKALFVVATYGEGEAPDNGQRFARKFLANPSRSGAGVGALDLSHLSYSVIALGDSTYERFCAFGQRMFDGMAQLGAKALEPLHKVDSALGDPSSVVRAMPQWFRPVPAAVSPGKEEALQRRVWWRLAARTLLNSGSPGEPLFELTLRAVSDWPKWRAGDIFELQPRQPRALVAEWLAQHQLDANEWIVVGKRGQTLQAWLRERWLPRGGFNREKLLSGDFSEFPRLPVREYSVASSHSEKVLKLIVRQQSDGQGNLGLGSGWLTEFCEVGELFAGRLRENSRCHTPDHSRPLLLIGAGSGLAGLRAQIAERSAQAASPGSAGPVWMVFGERCAKTDRPLMEEVDTWMTQGTLSRCDRVFSRSESGEPGYVQDFLARHSQDLYGFVSRGADIYVCGNREGMGAGVDRTLRQVLGDAEVDSLLDHGHYRRDLY
ncbi:NADPH cytochrome P450 oxidoreductase family protein [Microbulbifer sp. HZ11]|uniref:NADPH cytochrome P450 oxidoreductase family protein n=1 Tax=unclassified Microbulbifer TaxID=2619833 RepID=UPI000690AE5F|nr:NADPH cytochrome P450 oxidoreductase family protein [Microbulbifer sp. HZ11]